MLISGEAYRVLDIDIRWGTSCVKCYVAIRWGAPKRTVFVRWGTSYTKRRMIGVRGLDYRRGLGIFLFFAASRPAVGLLARG